MMLTADTI